MRNTCGFSDIQCEEHTELLIQSRNNIERDKVIKAFVFLITSEMVYDDGDMYYKVKPEKYVELLEKLYAEGEV